MTRAFLNANNSLSRPLLVLLLCIAGSCAGFAQATVTTLGGGPVSSGGPAFGDQDGDTLQQAQFHSPFGCALDRDGNLFVADRDNGGIRKLDLSRNRTSTVISGLNQPVAIAFDTSNNLFIANQGDGTLLEYDRFTSLSVVTTGLSAPPPITLSTSSILYVTELNGTIKRVNLVDRSSTVIATGLNQPQGIALMESGLLAVSESGNNSIRLINPDSGATIQRIGLGQPGFRDGYSTYAQFNQPCQLARAPSGNLVVADRGNHRVRIVTFDSMVTTLAGIDPSQWTSDLPGWEDGDTEYAEAREPAGIAVGPDGTVYVTELYYHLVRQISGCPLTPSSAGPGGSGAGTNLVLIAPVISPGSGYFPMGRTITVANLNTNAFFKVQLFYTTDGSEPTTNSLPVPLTNNAGSIAWTETARDLTSLQVNAFVDGASAGTNGQPAATNEIGVPRDTRAGIGATVVLPVVVDLRTNDQLRSLQFRVEVAPASLAVPPIPDRLYAVDMSTNDSNRIPGSAPFLPLAGSGGYTNWVPMTEHSNYSLTNNQGVVRRGVAISYLDQSGLRVNDFGIVAMLAVPIPDNASEGDQYAITVLYPSGTSDGRQTPVLLYAMPDRTITVTNIPYVVGDSAVAHWFNAGDFGNGNLNNNDVNNILYASLGQYVPLPFSDAFDAMDAFPSDSPGAVGGDGQIRFLDWNTILSRSLRIHVNRD
ncbi:MAG: hypothetical protein M1608_07920, partial [Candidatus Omnitrophica bacterium]|nr:hypothetical protein [Candidatus Omnitrophota bacterium]